MLRPVKYLLYFFALLLILLVGGAAALTALFDPNDYKAEIAAEVKKASSLQLNMPGEINWKLFPRLALSVGETELHTEKTYAGDTLFAKLDTFSMGISWRSLLKRALRADHLQVEGLQLRMVTDKRGHSNWKDIEASSAADTADTGTSDETGNLALELADLVLRDIAVRLVDQSLGTDQQFTVEQFVAQYVNFTGRAFPLELQARFDDGNQQFNLAVQADALVDNAREQYALQKLRGNLDDSRFTGQVKIGLGKQTSFDGELNVDELNIDKYLGETGASDTSGDSKGDAGSSATGNEDISFDALKSLNTKFRLNIGKLVAAGATLDTVSVDTAIANGVLNLKNMQAQVFGGSVQLAAKLDASRPTATLNVEQQLSQVEIREVFENREIDVNLSGTTSIKSNLAMRGNSVNAWLASLNGRTGFEFDEGRYGDDNIQYRVCQAIALARTQALGPALDTGTAFDSVRADIEWQNGVGRITAFNAGLENLKLIGDGTVSLLDQSFDLRVLANITGDISGSYPACAINEKYREI
ncbi:MAG: AsmA family protein, partial [Pseudomonadales bacterium]